MYSSLIYQEWPRNRAQAFCINISHTTCISTWLQSHQTFGFSFSISTTQGSAITMICPDRVISSMLFQKPFHILKLPPACSTTWRNFCLLLTLWWSHSIMHIPLDSANLNVINISTPGFHMWQHFTATGLQPTCRNWQMCLKFPLHNSTTHDWWEWAYSTIWDQEQYKGWALPYMEAPSKPRDLCGD